MILPFGKHDKNEIEVTVSTRTIVRILFLILLFLIGLAALKKASHALAIIFIAFFLALALNAPVYKIASLLPGSKKGSRTLATSLSFLLVAVLIGIFIASLAPSLVRQTEDFVKASPHLVSELQNPNSSIGRFVHKYHLEGEIKNLSSQLANRLKNVSGSAVTTIAHVGSSIFSVLAIIVITFMMLIEGPRWHKVALDLLPTRYHNPIEDVAHQMYRVIKGFVNGQVILALLAALLISPALFILHISYAAALIVVIFVCGLIPLVGHTIGAIIVTLVALLHSPAAALTILVYYILYQQIESYLIQPKIQANSTNMSPLLVFISVIIGVSFGGLFGGLVAIPLMGCLRILVLYYIDHRNNLLA